MTSLFASDDGKELVMLERGGIAGPDALGPRPTSGNAPSCLRCLRVALERYG